jgi:hypothetical protein
MHCYTTVVFIQQKAWLTRDWDVPAAGKSIRRALALAPACAVHGLEKRLALQG